MYIPKVNEEKRLPVLHDFIRAQPFCTLVTLGTSGIIASHIPIVLNTEGSEFGVLQCHISRANTQWRDLNHAVEAVAIFAGPHHYISASWYPKEDGKVVPTWNYAVVHAYGPLGVIEDAQWLRTHVETLTDIHESDAAEPWKVSDAPEDFIQSMLKGVVGLELPIRRLEGKWKVSQNRNQQERAGVIEGLTELNTPESLIMKTLVENANER